MVAEEQQPPLKEDAPEVPSEQPSASEDTHQDSLEADQRDLEVHEDLSEREVFAGNDDFYELLAASRDGKSGVSPSGSSPPAMARPQSVRPATSRLSRVTAWSARLSVLEKVIAVGILMVAAALLYALLKYPPWATLEDATTRPNILPLASKPPSESSVQVMAEKSLGRSGRLETVLSPAQPLSLKVAQDFFLEKDYGMAYSAYAQLHQTVSKVAGNELLGDFLQLRMALCAEGTGHLDQAGDLFSAVSRSRSPVVRALANYHLSFLEIQKKHFLKALTRAYQTITLIHAVESDADWALSLRRDCHFLIAEAMTKNVLLLCDADKDLPGDLWMERSRSINSDRRDPFASLNEEQLRAFLNSGLDQLSKGLLSPQIRRLENQGGPPRLSVVCNQASIEELLARFAANAGLEIRWVASEAQTTNETEEVVRHRPVCLYMPAVTVQQFVTAAAGCVGLVARLDDKETVSIHNPAAYTSLSEHISLLGKEAVSLWQRFLFTFHDDERVPNAHFALGLLNAQRDQLIDAIAEYRLVANRFSRTSLAPFALLYSSRLKTELHDYLGAREDLRHLVEQYPDAEFSTQACLYLADATMKAGLYDEAERLYRKVYNLDFTSVSRAVAALGAGRCCYEREDYEAAARWLTRYIGLAREQTSEDLYAAWFLLGRINMALGRPEQACEAFGHALKGPLTAEEQMEAVSGLANAYMQQEDLMEALDVLERVRSWQFSEEEFTRVLLLKASVLRTMGLVDKAIAMLGNRAQYWPETRLKARMFFELARCYIAKGNLGQARKNLSEILVFVEPGPLAHEIALELANVCLKLGQDSQTISVCSQLLDSGPSAQIRKKALALLAQAYSRQKDYDRAARALSGRWDRAEAPNPKRMFDSQATSG